MKLDTKRMFKDMPKITKLKRTVLYGFMRTNGELTPGQALLLWTYNLLEKSELWDDDSRWLIIETFGNDVIEFGDVLAQSIASDESRYPADMLVILDRKIVTVASKHECLNLLTKKVELGTECLPLEVITYNLTRLFITRKKAYEVKEDDDAPNRTKVSQAVHKRS